MEQLDTLFTIDFKSLPLLPIGIEDFCGGIIDNDLIITCGFGGNFRRQNKPPYWKSYDQRFFYNDTYRLDLNNMNNGFEKIINYPGLPRQKPGGIVIDNQLYTWGGLSYEPCKKLTKKNITAKKKNTTSHKDGYKLYKNNKGIYTWEKLPDLPENITGFSIANYGKKIYIFGGCDYYDSSFNTWTDRSNKVEYFGSRLFMIDTENISKGWIFIGIAQESNIIATPRMNHIGIQLNGNIYVLGGGTGRIHGQCFYSTVDNWKYNIDENKWNRIIDCPSSQTNWRHAVIYKNRYIILVGGVLVNGAATNESKIRTVINANKNITEPYGIIRQNKNKIYLDEYHKIHDIPENGNINVPIIVKGSTINKYLDLNPKMCGDIIVFDTQDEKFYKIDGINNDKIPLPINNNIPFVEIFNDNLIVLGGELDYGIFENIVYKGCTDLAIIGKIVEK
jgi:N-acetylneuraminic acid mutarotase